MSWRLTHVVWIVPVLLSGCFDDADVAWVIDTGAVPQQLDAGSVGTSGVLEPEPIDEYFVGGGELAEKSSTFVVQQLIFSGELEPGVAWGFDLDGVTTPDNAVESCGHGDQTSPSGEKGIDNNFARVWAFAEALIGEQVKALLQEAINEGRFLFMIELSDVSDLVQDDDVTVTLFRGMLDPMVSSAGFLLPSQTYRVDNDFPSSVVRGVELKDGKLRAGPLQFGVPVEIFDADFTLQFESGQIELEISEDGSISGVMGGSLNIGNALEELYNTGAKAEAELVTPLFESYADMERVDGVCQSMSAAIQFTATTAFLLR
ncbi:MAG: hypothetical protein VX223_15705 [Myxococcota bacterium]|nr:hypothetical protein [Myxococcota bacterium]